jgi:hypothetical protein
MAQLHLAGLGVEQDPEQAAHWYRRVIKSADHTPSVSGLVALIESKAVKWQPGDPGAPPPADQPDALQASVENEAPARRTTGPLAADAPDAPVSLAPEPEAITSFKTEQGPIIDARTRAGALTLFSTSDKPYHCEIDIKFTFLEKDGARQEGRFVCFNARREAGQKVEVCDVVHPKFVQTKVEKVELTKCAPPAAK